MKVKYILLLLSGFIFCFTSNSFAQNQGETITGTVTDAQTGKPLIGVNILVVGSSTGTVTNIEGYYSLNVSSLRDSLRFSYIGYEAQTIAIGGRTTINLALKSKVILGQQLVVVGFGAQQRSDLSSSIAMVDTKKISRSSTLSNVASALEGALAGVSVTTANGSPGSDINIHIRGSNTFGNNGPLVIIDGMPGKLSNLNSSDVKSMQVLKDAAAAAIYGSRAANGVIIVETKNGSPGKMKVDIKTSYGIQQPVNFIAMANKQQYAQIDNALHGSAGLPVFNALKNPKSLGAGINWQHVVYNQSPMWKAYMGISGGSENSTYRISGAYHKQEGIMTATWYREASIHFSGHQKVNDFTFNESIMWNEENRRVMPWGGDKPMTQQILLAQPVIPIHSSTNLGGFGGAPAWLATQAYNPLGLLKLHKVTHHNNSVHMDVQAQYQFFDHFNYKLNAAYSVNDTYFHNYFPSYYFSNQRQKTRASLNESRGRTHHWRLVNTLRYKQQFSKHNLSVLAGFSTQENHFRSTLGSKVGFPNNNLEVLNASTGFSINSGGEDQQWDMVSLFGRILYNYNDKYYLTATIRRDGSSRFGQRNRYGVFPSASVAWRVSRESFFTHLSSVITNLKLRASYGVLGNQPSGNYAYIPSLIYSTSLGYLFGGGYETGAAQLAFVNRNVKWETTKSVDIGMDMDIINNIHLTIDYFSSKTNDLLLNVPIPPSTGTTSSPLVNTGKVQNQGVELTLGYNAPTSGTFHYNISGHISTVRNNVLKLGFANQYIWGATPHYASSGPITAAHVGYPIGGFFMRQADGLFQNQKEISNYTHNGKLIQPDAKPGDVKYIDVNNDGKINAQDKKYSGSPFPNLVYGLSFNANYKSFDFTLFVQGTYGNKMFDTNTWITSRGTMDYNFNSRMLDAWTPNNKNTNVPRLSFNDLNGNRIPSTRLLFNASYLRFKTIQIGYNIPENLLRHAGFNKIRIFVSARNLWTITPYQGYDPSYTGDGLLNRGLDQGLYPVPRVFTAGVNIKF